VSGFSALILIIPLLMGRFRLRVGPRRKTAAILNLGSDPSSARRSRSMKWAGTKNLGMLLLSIWLIATGLLTFFQVAFVHKDLVMAALAIAAGILLLLGR
jgi:hypothetical protein